MDRRNSDTHAGNAAGIRNLTGRWRLHRIVIGLVLVLVLAMGLVGCGKSDEERWQEQYDLGVRYLDDGNYEEAIIAFNAAIEIDPKKAGSYVNRAAAYYAQDNTDAAVADYTTALDLDPSMADVYCAMADIYAAQGDPDLAQQILQQGIDACGEDETLLAKAAELGYEVTDGQVLTIVTADEYADVQMPEVPQAWTVFKNDNGDEDYRLCYNALTPELEEYLSRYIDLALNSDNTLDLSLIIDSDFLDQVMQDVDGWGYNPWLMMPDGAIVELWVEYGEDSGTRRCFLTYSPQNGEGFDWKYTYVSETFYYGSLGRARTVDYVFDGDYTKWRRGVYGEDAGGSFPEGLYEEEAGTLSMGWYDGVTTIEIWAGDWWHETKTLTYDAGERHGFVDSQ